MRPSKESVVYHMTEPLERKLSPLVDYNGMAFLSRTKKFARVRYVGAVISLVLFSSNTAAGSPPNVSTPFHQTFNSSGGSINGRSDVEIENGLSRRLRWTGVVINDITDLFWSPWCLALDIPIVSVEGRFSARKRKPVSTCRKMAC